MSEFKRKSSTGGFEASESKSGATGPDFSAIEPESGFSVDQNQVDTGSSFKRSGRAVEPQETQSASGGEFTPSSVEPASPSASPFGPADSAPAKKRYYNPGEVMKKKGCIGCGGMTLVLPIMLAILALVMVIF